MSHGVVPEVWYRFVALLDAQRMDVAGDLEVNPGRITVIINFDPKTFHKQSKVHVMLDLLFVYFFRVLQFVRGD